MITFDLGDLKYLSVIVVGFFAVLSAAMLLYASKRRGNYDDVKHRVELEMMRKSIESQMHGLTEKLIATESRWRDVNHLLISSKNRQPDMYAGNSRSSDNFLISAGLNPADLEVKENFVFVLTPFHPMYRKQYQAIADACHNLGLIVSRGDEEYVEGDVFPHILKQIARARLIITNINGRNPNVFYELGIAHGMGKPTILVASTPEEVPFDLRTRRLVLFSTLEELQEKTRDELARAMVRRETISSGLSNTST